MDSISLISSPNACALRSNDSGLIFSIFSFKILSFNCNYISRLAAQCAEEIRPKSSVKGLQCSLSGLENQCNALLAAGKAPEYVCKYCLLCVADTVVRMTKAAQKEYPGLPVVCAGGVMSSDIIRTWVQQRLPQVYFVPGQYSSDNAIGVSILAAREAGLWLM